MSPTTMVRGHTMAYEDHGKGQPVVLVHGNPTWSFYWRSLLEALPIAGMRAVAPDHIGMGRSDKPTSGYDYTLAERVADFAVFVDSLGFDGPIDLVVHDWGGPIALAWAAEHPDRVRRLVLMNTAAFPLPANKKLPFTLQIARWPVLGRFLVTRLNAFSRGATVLGSGRRMLNKDARKGLLKPYSSSAARRAVHEFIVDIPLSPADPAFPVLQRLHNSLPLLADKPMLICWGMKDFVFDAEILGELTRSFPAAHVRRYPGAGHYVLEDAAAEIVPEVVRFLSNQQ